MEPTAKPAAPPTSTPKSAPLPRELPRSSCTSLTLSRVSETFLFPSAKLMSRSFAESKRPERRSPSFVRTTIFWPGESVWTADQSSCTRACADAGLPCASAKASASPSARSLCVTSDLPSCLERFVDRMVTGAEAGGRAEGRPSARADEETRGDGSRVQVVCAREQERGRARARAAAEGRADDCAQQAVRVADLDALDAVALERDPAAVFREVDVGVGGRLEAALQAVAVLCADPDLLAGREGLNVRPVGGRVGRLGRSRGDGREREEERERECEESVCHGSLSCLNLSRGVPRPARA